MSEKNIGVVAEIVDKKIKAEGEKSKIVASINTNYGMVEKTHKHHKNITPSCSL